MSEEALELLCEELCAEFAPLVLACPDDPPWEYDPLAPTVLLAPKGAMS